MDDIVDTEKEVWLRRVLNEILRDGHAIREVFSDEEPEEHLVETLRRILSEAWDYSREAAARAGQASGICAQEAIELGEDALVALELKLENFLDWIPEPAEEDETSLRDAIYILIGDCVGDGASTIENDPDHEPLDKQFRQAWAGEIVKQVRAHGVATGLADHELISVALSLVAYAKKKGLQFASKARAQADATELTKYGLEYLVHGASLLPNGSKTNGAGTAGFIAEFDLAKAADLGFEGWCKTKIRNGIDKACGQLGIGVPWYFRDHMATIREVITELGDTLHRPPSASEIYGQHRKRIEESYRLAHSGKTASEPDLKKMGLLSERQILSTLLEYRKLNAAPSGQAAANAGGDGDDPVNYDTREISINRSTYAEYNDLRVRIREILDQLRDRDRDLFLRWGDGATQQVLRVEFKDVFKGTTTEANGNSAVSKRIRNIWAEVITKAKKKGITEDEVRTVVSKSPRKNKRPGEKAGTGPSASARKPRLNPKDE